MRENITRTYEADCLIRLLEALVNKHELPKFEQEPDWEKLYKLAIFQNISSITYCCLLGTDSYELDPWKEKLAKQYHKAVSLEGYYGATIPLILDALEEARIDSVLCGDYLLRAYYPKPEMRELARVDFLIEHKDIARVRTIMKDLDFTEEGTLVFTKPPGLSVIFQTRLNFLNKRFTKYFNVPIKRYVPLTTHRHIRGFEPEEFYLYLIATIAEDYAKGDIDMKLLLDFRCFYRALSKVMDWSYIGKECERLQTGEFPTYITKLATMWYDGLIYERDQEVLSEMEAYVLTKGESGRRESEKLLTLVKQVADIYERDLKKKKRRERVEILFPGKEYMSTMYNVLKRFPFLLPFCWLHRGVRLGKDKNSQKKLNKQ